MISVLVEPFVALNDLQMLVLAARRDVIDPRATFMSHMSVTMTHIFIMSKNYEIYSCSFLIIH